MWLNLGKVLDKKGMSAREFAKKLGKESSEVSKFFVPGYDPKFSMICRWVEVLGLKSVNELIDDSSNKDERVIQRPKTAIEATDVLGGGFRGKKKVKKTKKK